MTAVVFVPLVRVQAEPFDAAALSRGLTEGRSDVGALAAFTGLCRDEGGTLDALELEHYPGMAESQILATAEDAARRWPLLGLISVHRYGFIRAGQPIVFVAAAAAHRAPAFAAAEFMMDYLKTSAPFWKKERRKDGASSEWIEAKAQDDRATERWKLL